MSIHHRDGGNNRWTASNSPLTGIVPDQRCRERQEGQPHHQSRTAFGTALFFRGNVIGIWPHKKKIYKKRRCTLDGCIVLSHEAALGKLNHQGGFADAYPRIPDTSERPHSFEFLTDQYHRTRRACTLARAGSTEYHRVSPQARTNKQGQGPGTHPGHSCTLRSNERQTRHLSSAQAFERGWKEREGRRTRNCLSIVCCWRTNKWGDQVTAPKAGVSEGS